MNEKDYEGYAIRLLPKLFETSDFANVHEALNEKEPRFSKISGDQFGMEFLPLKLALAVRSWEKACEENNVAEESDQKALLRVIMNSFQSPKFLSMAAAFSDYLHTEMAESQPWIAMPTLFFKRLNIEPLRRKGGKEEINPAFEALVAASEAFRTDFENHFFEFVNKSES